MRRYLVIVAVLVLLGGVIGAAYGLSQPPSQKAIAASFEGLHKYRFTREVEFKQYDVRIVGSGTSKVVQKKFLYTGRIVTTGTVDLVKGTVKEHEEAYVNGSLVMVANAVFDLGGGKVSGVVTLPDGTKKDLAEFLRDSYGIDEKRAIEMLQANLPTILLRDAVLHSSSLRAVSPSPGDRIMMGLGLKEKLFEYRFTTDNRMEWKVFVDSQGRPVKFEYTREDAHMVVTITPLG